MKYRVSANGMTRNPAWTRDGLSPWRYTSVPHPRNWILLIITKLLKWNPCRKYRRHSGNLPEFRTTLGCVLLGR